MSAAEKIDLEVDDFPESVSMRQHLRIIGLEAGGDFNLEDAIDFLEEPTEEEKEQEDKMNEEERDRAIQIRVNRQLSFLKQTRQDVLEVVGVNDMDEVRAIAERISFAEDPNARNKKAIIRNRMLADTSLHFSEHKEADLKKIGERANKYVNGLIGSFFPDHHDFKMNNEVSLCHDPATLLLMSYDNSHSKKIRFEAGRKLLIMKMFGDMDGFKVEEIDNNEAMKDMMAFMNLKMIQMPEGFKKGEVIRRYLVHLHEPDKFKTIESRIIDEEEFKTLKLRPYEKVTPLAMRRTVVDKPDGTQLIIEHTVDGREKEDDSRGNKMIRQNAKIGEQDVDLNGFEMVFKNKEEWMAYFEKFLKEVQNDIIENLKKLLEMAESYPEIVKIQKRIESLKKSKLVLVKKEDPDGKENKIFGMYLSSKENEVSEVVMKHPEEFFRALAVKGRPEEAGEKFKEEMKHIDPTIVIHNMKDSMNGGTFKGKSKASSGKVEMFKLTMDLYRSDGRIHSYEYQVYLPGGFADAKFMKETSWKAYNVKRFFETGMDELVFPKKIYNSNRANDKKEAMERAHRELWNGHANGEKNDYKIREEAGQATFNF